MTLELSAYSAILFQCCLRCCSSAYFSVRYFEAFLYLVYQYAIRAFNYICRNNKNRLKVHIIHLTWGSLQTPCCVILIFLPYFLNSKTHKGPQHHSALITADWYWHFFLSVLGWTWVSPLVFGEEELVSKTSQLFLLANQLITGAWQGRIFNCHASHFAAFVVNAANQFHAIHFHSQAALHPSILSRLKRAGIAMKSKEQRGPKLRNPCMSLI